MAKIVNTNEKFYKFISIEDYRDNQIKEENTNTVIYCT